MNKNTLVFKTLTDQYIKDIASLTEQFSNSFHLIAREREFIDDFTETIFKALSEATPRFGSYLDDPNNCMIHEQEIYNLARETKERYDQ